MPSTIPHCKNRNRMHENMLSHKKTDKDLCGDSVNNSDVYWTRLSQKNDHWSQNRNVLKICNKPARSVHSAMGRRRPYSLVHSLLPRDAPPGSVKVRATPPPRRRRAPVPVEIPHPPDGAPPGGVPRARPGVRSSGSIIPREDGLLSAHASGEDGAQVELWSRDSDSADDSFWDQLRISASAFDLCSSSDEGMAADVRFC